MRVCEYILEYDKEGCPTFGYELHMNSLRNDRRIDYDMHGLLQFWLAKMDSQMVVGIVKLIVYMPQYATKLDIKN